MGFITGYRNYLKEVQSRTTAEKTAGRNADAAVEIVSAAMAERYLKLISAGGSDYPYDLVKAAGVDLATPEPYDALVKRMNRIMDEIEKILARKKM